MTLPKAYDPENGYMYQILVRFQQFGEWEHCDYAKDKADRDYLLTNYREAYRNSNPEFKVIKLPMKYWKE